MSKVRYCIVEHNPTAEDESDQLVAWSCLYDNEADVKDCVQTCYDDAADFPLGHTIFICKVVTEISRPNIKLKYTKVG